MTRIHDQQINDLYSQHLETLAARYTQALDYCDAERALIFAGTPQMRARDDHALPFRADPYFIQWVPLPEAAGSIVEFRVGHRPRLIFFAEEGFWHAPPAPPPHCVYEAFDVVMATSERTTDYLSQRGEKTVAIGQSGYDASGIEESQLFIDYLDYGRAIKTNYEIECLRRANRLAVAGHRAVELTLHENVSEFELHMQYCLASMQVDEQLPYPSIIGLNEHASVLHYQHRETTAPDEVRSLLIDAGAEVNGYAADVSRTYTLHEHRFAELIKATDHLQQKVCEMVCAGADFVTLNERCHMLLADLLVGFEFVSCSADDAYAEGATTAFLPHGLGHLLGLQVHDVGGHASDELGGTKQPPDRHPFLRLTRTLEADMTLTIEPGIYFIKPLLDDFEQKKPGILNHDAIDEFLPYGGIRIEDNVRVESHSHENLTRNAYSD